MASAARSRIGTPELPSIAGLEHGPVALQREPDNDLALLVLVDRFLGILLVPGEPAAQLFEIFIARPLPGSGAEDTLRGALRPLAVLVRGTRRALRARARRSRRHLGRRSRS